MRNSQKTPMEMVGSLPRIALREEESRATKRDLAKDYEERAEKQGFDPRNSSQNRSRKTK
jgi:hypothetical protein